MENLTGMCVTCFYFNEDDFFNFSCTHIAMCTWVQCITTVQFALLKMITLCPHFFIFPSHLNRHHLIRDNPTKMPQSFTLPKVSTTLALFLLLTTIAISLILPSSFIIQHLFAKIISLELIFILKINLNFHFHR